MSVMINLLPWREARRERLTRRFHLLLLAMLLCGGGLGYGVGAYYQASLDAQLQRNVYIRERTRELEQDIGQVHEYEARVSQLNEQLTLFQTLQHERVQTVRLFNAVALSTAPGVIYRQLARSADTIRATALASTDRQVSEQLRRIALTPVLGVPTLSEVENAADREAAARQFRFVVEQLGATHEEVLEEEISEDNGAADDV